MVLMVPAVDCCLHCWDSVMHVLCLFLCIMSVPTLHCLHLGSFSASLSAVLYNFYSTSTVGSLQKGAIGLVWMLSWCALNAHALVLLNPAALLSLGVERAPWSRCAVL